MSRTALWTVICCLLAGCGGGPPAVEDDAASAPCPDGAPPVPVAAGWLDPSDEAVRARAESCHMIETALADTTHSWLWLEVDLPGRCRIRALGPGALAFTLRSEDGIREAPDLGLFVALTHDANTFLNSQGGPITIRDTHAGSTGGRVKLLARLPELDTLRTVVDHVRPVPGRWIRK